MYDTIRYTAITNNNLLNSISSRVGSWVGVVVVGGGGLGVGGCGLAITKIPTRPNNTTRMYNNNGQ
jgi:hypothetical protein